MPTNNFKLFDQNKANLLSDTEYANATQRLNGVQTGVASSQLNNKFAYQVSLVAYAIAQIMNQNGLDASDTLSVSAFVGNLGGALLQKVADKASSAEAVAGVLENKYISPATMKAAALLLSGGVMTGTLDMNNNKITNLPSPTSNSEPATKEYVDGADPLFAKHKKIAILTNELISLSEQDYFDAKKIFSIIYKFNNYTVKINNTTGSFSVYYSVSKNNKLELIRDDIYSQTKVVSGEQFTLNNIIKKECIYIGDFNRPMLLTSGGYIRQSKYTNQDEIVRSVYLGVDQLSTFNYISGNIEIWIRTIDD